MQLFNDLRLKANTTARLGEAMLVITNEQLARCQELAMQNFYHRVYAHVSTLYKMSTPDEVNKVVDATKSVCEEYEIKRELDAAIIAELLVDSGGAIFDPENFPEFVQALHRLNKESSQTIRAASRIASSHGFHAKYGSLRYEL